MVESTTAAAHDIHCIEKELSCFDAELGSKERWLVCTKTDSMADDKVEDFRLKLMQDTHSGQPCFTISALSGKGLPELINAVSNRLEQINYEQTER